MVKQEKQWYTAAPMKSRLLNLTIVLSLLICTKPTKGEIPNRPVVISMRGTWSLEHGGAKKLMKSGDKVDERDYLIREATKQFQTFGSITVLIDGKEITVSCSDPQSLPHNSLDCSDRISAGFFEERAKLDRNDKKSNQEDASLVSSLMTRIQTLFNSPDAGEFFTANVRDVGSLEDAVLRKEGNVIDWKPAFNHLSKGEFEAQVLGALPLKVRFSWNPSQGMVLEMNGLGRGLQKLHIETTDGEVVGDVWVLIEDPANFEAKATQFSELKKRTSAWGSDVPPSGVEAVLRGGLTELAR